MLEDRGDSGLQEQDKQTNHLMDVAKKFNDGSGGPVLKKRRAGQHNPHENGHPEYERDNHGNIVTTGKTAREGPVHLVRANSPQLFVLWTRIAVPCSA